MSGLIPPVDLARLQIDAAALLEPEAADILRLVRTSGPDGWEDDWQVSSTVAGSVAPLGLTPQEQAIAARFQTEQLVRITLPVDADVQPADRIRIEAVSWDVIAIARRSFEISRRCICKATA